MTAPEETAVVLESEGLRLEGRLHAGGGRLSALVLHPHPLYGGDMDNHVVRALCATLAEAGATTLRFNLPGAGGSEGRFDGEDLGVKHAMSAARVVREAAATSSLVLAGYSFGARVAAGAADDIAPSLLLLVSPPLSGERAPSLPVGLPVLAVTGGSDRIAPPAALDGLRGPDVDVRAIAGVDHGWWPGVEELCEVVRGCVEARMPLPD